MIALALGALLMLGVTEILGRDGAVRSELERNAARIENGMFALRTLEQELVNAGFVGETGGMPRLCDALSPPLDPSALPRLLAASRVGGAASLAEAYHSLLFPVQGRGPGGAGPAAKAGTDTLAIRRASSCAAGDAGCDPVDAGDVYLQVSGCAAGTAAAPPPGCLRLAHARGRAHFDPPLDLQRRDCIVAAPVYRFLARVYYVDSHDHLMQSQLENGIYASEQLAQGVEMLRFEYGLDNGAGVGTAGDGQVDEFRDPVGAEWSDVVAVRIHLVVRSLEPSPGHTDTRRFTVAGRSYTVPAGFTHYRREVLSRTVSLANMAGRRQ